MRKKLSYLAIITALLFACKYEELRKCKEVRIVEFCRPEPFTDPQTGQFIGTVVQTEIVNREMSILANNGWHYVGPLYNNGINCLNILLERDAINCPTAQDAGISRR
jgi:hypothetical protein